MAAQARERGEFGAGASQQFEVEKSTMQEFQGYPLSTIEEESGSDKVSSCKRFEGPGTKAVDPIPLPESTLSVLVRLQVELKVDRGRVCRWAGALQRLNDGTVGGLPGLPDSGRIYSSRS